MGTAQFERTRCIVETDGTDCAACSEHCPTKAVDTVPFRENLRLPQVKEELCIGCGACEFACPVRPQRAITVAARATHVRARQAVEAKPTLPKPAGDFPF
ncbi:4Fe-4S dicluster domain-containing protein [Oleiharenicola sp. Vm1]|uniref:4Fe-4S dicluster domain-containing protein n=1 Tax=Oleiharenicola sp. Vm1 TaxID=3398393 RepID=UPI0039F540C1